MISKIDLRKEILEKRKTLETNVLSAQICEKIKNKNEYINAQNVFAYYPKPFEVDIKTLFKDERKKWFLPKIIEDNLIFYEYKFGDELIKGEFGVYIPKSNIIANFVPDLIIVPALCADKNNYRLGYGKGYYDRFLTKFNNGNAPITLAPIFSELIIETLPVEAHDKKINIIVSENG